MLPASPADGDICFFQNAAMATAGATWQLRYRSGASGSYKWEFVGGSSLLDVTTGATTRALPTYGDVAAGAAVIYTLALGGDYIIEVGGNLSPGYAGQGMYMSFSVNGATALDTDAAQAYYGSTTAPGQSSSHNVATKTGLAAATTIQAKFKAQGPTAGNVDRRYIRITPVRVG